jgi:hypothetical protein
LCDVLTFFADYSAVATIGRRAFAILAMALGNATSVRQARPRLTQLAAPAGAIVALLVISAVIMALTSGFHATFQGIPLQSRRTAAARPVVVNGTNSAVSASPPFARVYALVVEAVLFDRAIVFIDAIICKHNKTYVYT